MLVSTFRFQSMIIPTIALALLSLHQQKPVKPIEVAIQAGRYEQTIEEGSVSRSFIVDVPKSYQGKAPIPLVIVLHGWTSNAKQAEIYTMMRLEAEKEGFAVVFPNGLGTPQGWNCGFINLGGAGADDTKFLTDVIAYVEGEVKIDTRRVYVCGHSNGAFMSYVMGSALSHQIAAIGVVAGTIGLDNNNQWTTVKAPDGPVSAVIFHGQKDQMVWSGSSTKALLSNAIPPMDSAAWWARAIGITTPPKTMTLSSNCEVYDWKGKLGQEVKYYSILNGTHDWPGGYGYNGPETNTGINAADLIWKFFKAHPLIPSKSNQDRGRPKS